MFPMISNQHYPHRANEKLRSWANAVFQNRGVCGQAVPSFPSPSSVIHFFLLLSQFSRRTSPGNACYAGYKCSCKGFVSKAKQEKSRALCVHLHVLFCSLELFTHGDSDPASASTSPAQDTSFSTFTPGITSNKPTTSLEAPSSSQQEPNNSRTASPETPSVSRLSTLNLYSTFKLPYHFSSEYLNNVSVRDASTLLGCDNGWPSVIEVKEVTCQICGEPLGTSKIHSGMRGGSILYTNLNPFKDVVVKVKECTSVECRAMHRVCPSEEGIIIIFVFTLI